MGGITQFSGDNGEFKVSSLRNIALTGPYMHDGRFKSLNEVIAFYSFGIHKSADSRLVKAVLQHPRGIYSPRARTFGFGFNQKERRALVAFLHTLTDEAFVNDPRFSDPFRRDSTLVARSP